MQSHLSSFNRRAYGIRAVEFCIQALVIAIISFGWYTSLLEVGVGWLARHEERYIAAAIYMTIVGILFPFLAILYLHACSGRATHSVPIYAAPEPQSLTEPYECRSDGSFDFCVKDNCKMRWKPPGVHHCSTCGVCRVGFDHHCPWLGNCVTTRRLKSFLALLVLTLVTVPLAGLPILPMVRAHVVSALAVSHADTWATDVWWDRPYSWILCGGPLGRWVVGTLLGFRSLRTHRGRDSWLNGSLIAQPHVSLIILVGAATLLWLFAVLMTIAVAVDVTRGQEGVRVRFAMTRTGKPARVSADRFVCIPYSNRENSPESLDGQPVYPIPTDVRIYDLGWRENWRRVLAQSLFDDGTPCRGVYEWPKFNPEMMRRMLGTEKLGDTTQRYERKSHSTFS